MSVLEDTTVLTEVDEACDDNLDQALCYAAQIANLHTWRMATIDRTTGLSASALDGDTIYTVHFATPRCGDGGKATETAAMIIVAFRLAASYGHAFAVLRKPNPADPEHTFHSFGRCLVAAGERMYP